MGPEPEWTARRALERAAAARAGRHGEAAGTAGARHRARPSRNRPLSDQVAGRPSASKEKIDRLSGAARREPGIRFPEPVFMDSGPRRSGRSRNDLLSTSSANYAASHENDQKSFAASEGAYEAGS